MSLQTQFSALYRLYYKRNEREAFLREGKPPVSGLSDAELAQLHAIEPARLRRVVDLHAGDIGLGWYRPRVPATWLALQAVLGVPEAELVQRVAESPGFETRINDDSDARALDVFVGELGPVLDAFGWVRQLLRFERLLGCNWPDGPDTRLERFTFDVASIRESLLQDKLCPTEEPTRITWILLHRGKHGVNELSVRQSDAVILADLIAGRLPKASPGSLKRCQAFLRDIRS